MAPQAGITYILAPFRVPPERQRTTPVATRRLREARPSSPLEAPSPASQPVPATVPQAITQTAPPPDPFALPAKPDEDLRQRSLKSAAAVDKQLRKEAWNPRDKFVANDQTALAANIGGAYIGRDSSMTVEEVTLPDGRLMTKIHGPAGTYCAYKESNAVTGGRDPFRDGVKTKIGTCPM
jgi:hypothetical protein